MWLLFIGAKMINNKFVFGKNDSETQWVVIANYSQGVKDKDARISASDVVLRLSHNWLTPRTTCNITQAISTHVMANYPRFWSYTILGYTNYPKSSYQSDITASTSILSLLSNFFFNQCDLDYMFRIMIVLLKCPATKSLSSLLDPMTKIVQFAIQKARFKLKYLMEMSSLCNKIFTKVGNCVHINFIKSWTTCVFFSVQQISNNFK